MSGISESENEANSISNESQEYVFEVDLNGFISGNVLRFVVKVCVSLGADQSFDLILCVWYRLETFRKLRAAPVSR